MDKNEQVNNIKNILAARKEIRFAYLFGSFVGGEHFRDIDVAIFIDETDEAAADKFYDIQLACELEEKAGLPVDIVVLNHAPAAIVYNASNGLLLKDSDEDSRIDFITSQWKMYWDLKPVLKFHMEARKHAG